VEISNGAITSSIMSIAFIGWRDMMFQCNEDMHLRQTWQSKIQKCVKQWQQVLISSQIRATTLGKQCWQHGEAGSMRAAHTKQQQEQFKTERT